MRRIWILVAAIALLSAAPVFAGQDGDKSTSPAAKTASATDKTAKPAIAPKSESSSVAIQKPVIDAEEGNGAAANPSIVSVDKPASSAHTVTAQTDQGNESPLFFKIGGAEFTPLGFMDFTSVYRSTDVGSGIGTNFNSIPFNGLSPVGPLSELRFSAQNSRVGIRVDASPGDFKVRGYL
jgi:hypothetical protein